MNLRAEEWLYVACSAQTGDFSKPKISLRRGVPAWPLALWTECTVHHSCDSSLDLHEWVQDVMQLSIMSRPQSAQVRACPLNGALWTCYF